MPRRILILNGHPDPRPSTFVGALATAYAAGAAAGGHEVRRIDVGALALPPVRTAAEFEGSPALEAIGAAQADIAWCDHLVIAHPLWHGMHPAALKAFFEQTFRYGFAMTNEARGFPKPLLTGKSARSIVTMGMPAFIYRWWFGAYAMRALETSLLGLAGIRPQRRTIIGGLGALTREKAAAHLKAVEELGRRGV